MYFPIFINWTSKFPILDFSFVIKFLKKRLFANSGRPDQTPRFAASGLVLRCLPMSNKKDARLILVKNDDMTVPLSSLDMMMACLGLYIIPQVS